MLLSLAPTVSMSTHQRGASSQAMAVELLVPLQELPLMQKATLLLVVTIVVVSGSIVQNILWFAHFQASSLMAEEWHVTMMAHSGWLTIATTAVQSFE